MGRQTEIYAPELVTLVVAFHVISATKNFCISLNGIDILKLTQMIKLEIFKRKDKYNHHIPICVDEADPVSFTERSVYVEHNQTEETPTEIIEISPSPYPSYSNKEKFTPVPLLNISLVVVNKNKNTD